MKDNFILYTEQQEIFDKLSDEQAGKLIKAIFSYVATGEVPELDTLLDLVFVPIRQTLDRNKEKYDRVSEIRSKAGAKGGSKTKQNKQMLNLLSKKSNCCVNDNDNDNVHDNDSDNVSVNDSVCVNNAHTNTIDVFFDKNVTDFVKEYKKVFLKNPYLQKEDRAKIVELVQTVDDFWKILPEVLTRLKGKTFHFRDGTTKKPDVQWLLTDRNFTKLANEEDTSVSQESDADFFARKRKEWEDSKNV